MEKILLKIENLSPVWENVVLKDIIELVQEKSWGLLVKMDENPHL